MPKRAETDRLEHERDELVAKLAEREALLSSLLESSPAGLVLGTRDGRIRFASAKWCATVGYTQEELTGTLTRDLYADPADREPALGVLERDGRLRDYECRFRRKDGSEFWGVLNSSFVDVGGERLLATWVQDVTERHETLAALASANEEQNAIFTATTMGIALVKDRTILRCNRRLEEVFGYEPGEMLDRPTRIMYDSEEEAAKGGGDVYVRIWRGETDRREQRMVRKDGTPFWCRLSGRAVDVNDSTKGTVWILEDFTEERNAAQALARALDDLKAIYETSPHGMGVARERRYIHVNSTLERMLGYGPGEMLGQSTRIIYDNDETFLDAGERLYAMLRSGRTFADEFRLVRKDGSKFWCRITAAAMNRADPIQGTLGIYEDVTEIREATGALAQALENQKAIYDTSPHGIAVTQERRIVQTNASFDRMFGYAPGELTGQSTRIVYESDEGFEAAGNRGYPILQCNELYVDEMPMVRKDGTRFWARLTAAALNRSDAFRGTLGVYEDVTETREAAAALQQALDRQEKIFQASPHGIATYANRRFVVASPAMERMFGYRPGEMSGLSARVIQTSDEEYERVGKEIYGQLRSGHPMYIEETRLTRKDGSTFWVRVTLAALDREDPMKGIIGIYEDITERKAADRALQAAIEEQRTAAEALRQALDRQERIFEASPHGIATFEQRRFVLASPAFERMFGYERGELLGKPARIIQVSDAEYEEAGKDVYGALRTGETVRVHEKQLMRKDGTVFWARITAAALDRDDPLRGVIAIYEDITGRMAAQQALRAAHEQQQAIFRSVTSGIALIQGNVIVDCNRRLEELFGRERREFLRSPIGVFGQDEIQQMAARIAQGKTYRGEHKLTRLDGTQFWCRVSGRAIDPNDLGRGSVWMLDDATEERAAAEALREAKKIAEKATRAKSMFLANMSHEIRTPMNAIIGMSHLALKTDLDSRQRDYVEKVHHAGTSLLGIINDVLDFSKIEAGKLDMESIDFSLDEVLANLTTLVGQKVADKKIGFRVDVPPKLPRNLVGDPLRLSQILVNLVNNAVKFTERGRIEVRIVERERSGDRIKLEAEVRDTGIGMSREQIDRLFQAFSQADGSITRKFGGTGLGLTICRRLVELMSGTIWVESEPGAGSRFCFNAWLGLGAERESRAAPAVEQKSWALAGASVLLAEDNEINQQIAVELLQSEGVAVDVVGSGADAVTRVCRSIPGTYDAVLMDLQMPEMGGIEATRAIRADAAWNSLPIIAITSHAMSDERQRCLDAGMQDHITKPIDPEALYRTLAAWCRPRETRASAAASAPDSRARKIPAVKGLDAASGLMRVAGNHKLYLELLRQYVEGQSDAARSIRAMLAAGERSTAERIAHTARGVSGNIGADAVHDAADRLEQAIRAGGETERGVALFESTLDDFVGRLGEALRRLADGAAPAAAGRVDAEAIASALTRLAALLKAGDGEALDVFASEKAALESALGDDFVALEKAVNAFDFDSALERLRRSASQSGVTI